MVELIRGYKAFFSKKRHLLPRIARGIFNRAVLGRPYLRVCEIATTFMCNSGCIMCSCSKLCSPEKEKGRMGAAEYELLGRQLDELGCISVNVTGGEPLVRKDITEIISALNPKNKIMNLITNGINLTRDAVRTFASLGIDTIVVSLESTDADENDNIRGYRGHFKCVTDALAWAKEENVNFAVSLTLGDFNFDKVYELLRFAGENSAFLCIAHAGQIGNWSHRDSIRLSENNARRLLMLVKRYKRMKTDFSANLRLRPGCPAIMEKIYVTPYAEVFPCAFNPISFGNLRREALKDIWSRMINFYKENIHTDTLCLRTYNAGYIDRFLKPIGDMPQPVRFKDHPAFLPKREGA